MESESRGYWATNKIHNTGPEGMLWSLASWLDQWSFFLGGNNAELITQKEGAESSAMQCSAKQEVAMIALPDDRK